MLLIKKACIPTSVWVPNGKKVVMVLIEHTTAIVWSGRPEVFIGKCVLKICSKFTGEHPCQSVISVVPPVWCHINFVRLHQFVIVVFLMIQWKVFFFQDPAQPVLTGWNNFPTLYVSTSITTCFCSSSVYFFPINIHIGMFFYDFFVPKNKYLVKVFWQ